MTLKPKAFLIHGFLGAGKTTFAKRLERDEKAIRFTQDEWMSHLYGDDPPVERFQDYKGSVSRVMEGVWTRCLDLGMNVVLDSGLWSREERDQTRALVARHGGEAVIYRLNCAEDIARKRIEQRNQALAGSLYIARNTFEVLKPRFEPLGQDEPRIEIDSHDPM